MILCFYSIDLAISRTPIPTVCRTEHEDVTRRFLFHAAISRRPSTETGRDCQAVSSRLMGMAAESRTAVAHGQAVLDHLVVFEGLQ